MAKRAPKPELEWGELHTSSDFRELFRYEKAGRTRVYNLRVLAEGAELWVVSEEAGKIVRSQKKVTFEDPDDVPVFLEDVERELRAGGWMIR